MVKTLYPGLTLVIPIVYLTVIAVEVAPHLHNESTGEDLREGQTEPQGAEDCSCIWIITLVIFSMVVSSLALVYFLEKKGYIVIQLRPDQQVVNDKNTSITKEENKPELDVGGEESSGTGKDLDDDNITEPQLESGEFYREMDVVVKFKEGTTRRWARRRSRTQPETLLDNRAISP